MPIPVQIEFQEFASLVCLGVVFSLMETRRKLVALREYRLISLEGKELAVLLILVHFHAMVAISVLLLSMIRNLSIEVSVGLYVLILLMVANQKSLVWF